MSGGLHLPTALLVLALCAVVAIGWASRRGRRRDRGFLSHIDRHLSDPAHRVPRRQSSEKGSLRRVPPEPPANSSTWSAPRPSPSRARRAP